LFMDTLYDKLKHEQIKKLQKEEKEMGKATPKVRSLTKRELEVHTLHNVKGLTLEETAKELGLSFQRVGAISKNIEKKGQIPKETAIFNKEHSLYSL